jgi:hypothetical protein
MTLVTGYGDDLSRGRCRLCCGQLVTTSIRCCLEAGYLARQSGPLKSAEWLAHNIERITRDVTPPLAWKNVGVAIILSFRLRGPEKAATTLPLDLHKGPSLRQCAAGPCNELASSFTI